MPGNWGLSRKPKHVPWPGMEPMTFKCMEWPLPKWVTLARALDRLLKWIEAYLGTQAVNLGSCHSHQFHPFLIVGDRTGQIGNLYWRKFEGKLYWERGKGSCSIILQLPWRGAHPWEILHKNLRAPFSIKPNATGFNSKLGISSRIGETIIWSQREGGMDDLFIRNSPESYWKPCSKYHVATLDRVASSGK